MGVEGRCYFGIRLRSEPKSRKSNLYRHINNPEGKENNTLSIYRTLGYLLFSIVPDRSTKVMFILLTRKSSHSIQQVIVNVSRR